MSRTAPEQVSYPWASNAKVTGKEELKRLDDWQKLFVPQGAILAGSSNQRHWLTFGTNSVLPVLFGVKYELLRRPATQALNPYIIAAVGPYFGFGSVTQSGLDVASESYTETALGAHLAIVKGNRVIKRAFEAVTLLVGLKLIIG